MSAYSISQLIKVAELYYYRKKNQKEISILMGVSPATVSRMLQEALEIGVVKVKIEKVSRNNREIEKELEKKYNLKRAVVIKTPSYNKQWHIKKLLGKAAGELFYNIIQPGDKIGIGPGETILEFIESLNSEKSVIGLQIIPLMGGWGLNKLNRETNKLVSTLANVLQCNYYLLLAPAIVSSLEVKNILLNEPQIKQVVEMWKDINIAIFSIGPEIEHSIYSSISDEFYNNRSILRKEAVGDIVGRIINNKGKEVDVEFNHKIVSISLEQLKKIPIRLGIGGGQYKYRSVKAVLDGGLINYLVTDYKTGLYVLENGGIQK